MTLCLMHLEFGNDRLSRRLVVRCRMSSCYINVKSSWNAWNALCDAMRVCKEQLVSVLRSLIFFILDEEPTVRKMRVTDVFQNERECFLQLRLPLGDFSSLGHKMSLENFFLHKFF